MLFFAMESSYFLCCSNKLKWVKLLLNMESSMVRILINYNWNFVKKLSLRYQKYSKIFLRISKYTSKIKSSQEEPLQNKNRKTKKKQQNFWHIKKCVPINYPLRPKRKTFVSLCRALWHEMEMLRKYWNKQRKVSFDRPQNQNIIFFGTVLCVVLVMPTRKIIKN